MVQFTDGQLAISEAHHGAVLTLGEGSDQKHARHFYEGGGDYALIKTDSGNVYGIGDGVIVNYNTGDTCEFGIDDEVYIQIGVRTGFPKLNNGRGWVTTPIEEVLLQHGIAAKPFNGAAQLGEENPFHGLKDRIRIIQQQRQMGPSRGL